MVGCCRTRHSLHHPGLRSRLIFQALVLGRFGIKSQLGPPTTDTSGGEAVRKAPCPPHLGGQKGFESCWRPSALHARPQARAGQDWPGFPPKPEGREALCPGRARRRASGLGAGVQRHGAPGKGPQYLLAAGAQLPTAQSSGCAGRGPPTPLSAHLQIFAVWLKVASLKNEWGPLCLSVPIPQTPPAGRRSGLRTLGHRWFINLF